MFMNRVLPLIFLTFVSLSSQASDLVSVDWLQQHLTNVKIIDLRPQQDYEMGHVPHSINIPYDLLTREKNGVAGFVITPAQFKQVMEQHGVKNSDTVVLYGDWSFLYSMRVYWIFDVYAHEKTKVLDGGLQAWQTSQKKLSTVTPKITPSQYTVNVNPSVLSTKFRTFMASKNNQYVLVDARDSDQYNGKQSLTNRYGHIPSAINIPWVDLINQRNEKDGYNKLKIPSSLKDLSTLQKRFAEIPLDKKVIVYCNGGQESSVIYFAMKELGRKASLYDGSWYEWSADKNLPIE